MLDSARESGVDSSNGAFDARLRLHEHGMECARTGNPALRQPLTAAIVAVEVQRQSPSAERRTRAAEVIEQQLRQMMRLVDDLRDLAHISQGTLELRRQHVDLRVIVQQAIDMTTTRFDGKHHRITVDLGPAAAWVSADEARMTQVFSKSRRTPRTRLTRALSRNTLMANTPHWPGRAQLHVGAGAPRSRAVERGFGGGLTGRELLRS